MKCEALKDYDEKYNYQLLDRLKSDCEYYIGNGGRCPKYLWAKNEVEHIETMKLIWNKFPNEKKPEWLTWEQILNYEKEMIK